MPVPDVAVPAEPPAESPTGSIILPQPVVRAIALATGASGVLAGILHTQIGHSTVAEKVLLGTFAFGTWVLSMTQGVRGGRRKPTQ